MPASFKEYGLDREKFDTTKDEIAAAALKDGTTSTNPRKPSQDQVLDILEKSYS
jgi:alcohol dehydrogenase class IV